MHILDRHGQAACMPPEKLAKMLEKCGFELERISGSHHFYHNPETKKSTVVPFHGKDVPKGLLNEILKEAGIGREEFFDILQRPLYADAECRKLQKEKMTMNLKILRLTLHSDAPMRGDASKLRGFFATSFLLHQHVTDKLIYKYPLIQYKMLQGSPLVLGINEGAEVLKEIYDKFDEIKLGESKYSIMERGVTLRNEDFGCSEEIHSYRFASPWLALSQENYPKYRDASWEERPDLLRRILVGNILSASKGLGYVAKEHIRLDVGRMQDEICLLKGMKVTGIRGEFTASFAIPDYMGLGKSVSRGYGTVTRLK